MSYRIIMSTFRSIKSHSKTLRNSESFDTLMSLMSCCVGVSMGTLLSIAPCMAFAHRMASFSILVYRR